ncbi:MAG TPA: ABC transporter permease [Bryobacteraceae bacterium]|nr:ABC transporter permease [Bryobacteraceae bacterium]
MSWFSRLKNAVSPRRLDHDLADELRDHLERRAAELRKAGLEPTEAQRQAALRFGNTTLIRESSREIRLWAALESILQDARYAWRGMMKSPAVEVTVILSLSLAIGANTAIYSILDAAMLRPLPIPEPNRLVRLASPGIEQPGSDIPDEREAFNYPMYLDMRKAAGTAVQLALIGYVNRIDASGPENGAPTEKVGQSYLSGDAFQILGVGPALGRVLSPDDDRAPGASPVAVLSYDYWQRRFNGDPHVLGREIYLETHSTNGMYQVVGVARKGFFGVEPGKFVDIWVPAMMYNKEAFTNPGWSWFRIVGRMATGTRPREVKARLQPIFHDYEAGIVKRIPTMPPAIANQFLNAQLRVYSADAGVSDFRRDYSRPLWIILAVAGGIFLIACANVASLLLAKVVSRSGEMAMRISLGAGRLRLIRQLLTESLLLAALAGALGWVLARTLAPLLVHLLSTEGSPVQFALAINSRVLLFCAAVSAVATIFFGLLPAWQAAGVQPMTALRGMTGQASRLRMGRFMVAVQVGFAFCLVAAGAAFLFSLWNLFSVNTGFDARNVVVLDVSSDLRKQDKNAQLAMMKRLQDAVSASPEVEGAAVAPWAIFSGSSWTDQVMVPGKGPSVREEIFYRVSPGYFKTLRTPVLYGHPFDRHDGPDQDPIPTVVNVAFARQYLGGENVVGKTFDRPEGKKRAHHQVVGVVANANYGSLRRGAEPIVYLPNEGASYFSLYIRSPLDVGSVVRTVERATPTVGPGVRVRQITTLSTLVGNTILREKLLADIGGTFAFLGLVLAAIGLFGVLNYAVARRTREIGIRAALGAQRAELVMLVGRDLLAMIGGGLIAGLIGSLALLLAIKSLLFGLKAVDPTVLLTAVGLFFVAGVIAAGFPAGRAASVDPVIALRQE